VDRDLRGGAGPVRHAYLIALVLLLAACGGGKKTFTNPVYDHDFPDPFVLKVGDTYYAYATNGAGKQVQTLTSKDLVHWTPGADALPTPAKAWAHVGATWAPEVIHLDNGTYVLYYTSGRCIGRAVAKRPLGPFVDDSQQPLVCQLRQGGSIDASPFRDGSALYLVWKNDGNSIGQKTIIWSQRLSGDGLRLIGRRARLETNDRPWEASVVEGPMLWQHDGRLYLFYSGNDYTSSSYAVGYATCRSPLGPCTDAAENPILRSACRASGPGHNALIEVRNQTWIVYHAWLPGHVGDKRVLWIDRLDWRDGKPVAHGPTCTAQPVP